MRAIIYNRDIRDLEQVLSTMQEIRRLEEQKLWIRERLTNVTQRLSFSPGGGGRHDLSDGYADLQELEAELDERLRKYRKKLAEAETILNRISDMNMRTFVTMLYVERFSKATVMKELNMTRRDFENARRAVENAPDMARVVWRGGDGERDGLQDMEEQKTKKG